MTDENGVSEVANQTLLHPVGLFILGVSAILTLVLPRRFALLPMLFLVCLVPSAHRVVILGLDFSFPRLLAMVAWGRVLARKEARGFEWNPIDRVFVAWVLVGAVVYSARYANATAAIRMMGTAFDAAGLYFLTRVMVQSWADLARLASAALVASLPTAVAFAIESQTGRNFFSVLGGVPEYTVIREGRLRCQGAFQHPILAGIFWTCLAPLVAARWWDPSARRAGVVVGVSAVVFIIFACSSSTPVLGLAAALGAALLFPIRFQLRWVRRGTVLVLIALQLVMNAPVWHLISRVGVVGGSTGWHRFHLIDQFIKRFAEWAPMGVNSTAHWGLWLEDATNFYVQNGVRGGIWTLALFIALLTLCFREVGLTLRAVDRRSTPRAYTWALGVALFAHTVVMMAASYFGQIMIVLYLNLGAIGSLRALRLRERASVRRKSVAKAPVESHLAAPEASVAPAGASLARLLRPSADRP